MLSLQPSIARVAARVFAVSVFVLVLQAGCGNACGKNSAHVDTTGTIGPRNTEHKLFCKCQFALCPCAQDLANQFHRDATPKDFIFPVCLPPGLNTSTGDMAAIDAIPDGGYDEMVRGYCEGDVAQFLRVLVPYVVGPGGGSYCGDCSSYVGSAGLSCTTGGGDPAFTISCATVAMGAEGDATMPEPSCDQNQPVSICPASGCPPGSIFDEDMGTVHPENCLCNESENLCGPDGGLVTSPVVERPMGGSGDPPPTTGLLAGMLSQPSPVNVDSATSNVQITIQFDDAAGISHSDSRSSPVSGQLSFYGRPCPHGSCDLRMEMGLRMDPVTFHFASVTTGYSACADPLTFFICPDIQDVDVAVTDVSLGGGTGATTVHVDSSGFGRIPIGAMPLHAEANFSGIPGDSVERKIFNDTNSTELDFVVDFANKSFTVNNFPFNFDGGSAHLTIHGKVANQPPVAVVGPDQTVECTSKTGTTVQLDGSATTDIDNNVVSYAWWIGQPLDSTHAVTAGLFQSTPQITAPLGTTQYWLSATDAFMAVTASPRPTTVIVADTTPPVVTLRTDANGVCQTLWPPDHTYHSLSVEDCISSVVDQCDGPLPIAESTRIVRITSDEADDSGGDGSTCNDIVITGQTTANLRAERDGTGNGRVYTVFIAVKDQAGNETNTSFNIQVPHDQASTPATAGHPQYCVGNACGAIPGSNCP